MKKLLLLSTFLFAACTNQQSPSDQAQVRFDRCQNLKKQVVSRFSYAGKIDCDYPLLSQETVHSDWKYKQIPSSKFSLSLPPGAEFTTPSDSVTNVYLLPASTRKRPSQKDFAFFLTLQACSGEQWCAFNRLQVFTKERNAWADLERDLLLVAYEPNPDYSHYGFSLFSPVGHYYLQMNPLSPESAISEDQFKVAIDIMRSIQYL